MRAASLWRFNACQRALAKNLELIMKMVARGISVQGRLSSRRRRSPCKQRAAPWSSSWCCRLGAEALTPSRPNCQLGNVRLAYRASRCGRTRGRRHLHPAMLFFWPAFFFPRCGGKEGEISSWELSRRTSSGGRRGVISQEARRPVYQTLPFRGSNVDVRAAGSAPPGMSRRQRNGAGCPVGNRRRCWNLWGTRLASLLDVSCSGPRRRPRGPYQTESRDFPKPPSLFVNVDGQTSQRAVSNVCSMQSLV